MRLKQNKRFDFSKTHLLSMPGSPPGVVFHNLTNRVFHSFQHYIFKKCVVFADPEGNHGYHNRKQDYQNQEDEPEPKTSSIELKARPATEVN